MVLDGDLADFMMRLQGTGQACGTFAECRRRPSRCLESRRWPLHHRTPLKEVFDASSLFLPQRSAHGATG